MRCAKYFIVLSAVFCTAVSAQSNLPQCQGSYASSTWHNCYGIARYPNGDRYEGEWRDGKTNGRGIYYVANGNRYEGEFRDGKYNGRGIYYWTDGDRYEGEYRDDKRNGRGIAYHANGDRYEGEWRDGKKHGRGIAYRANGNRYEGEFRDGQEGRGISYFANGDRYEGGHWWGKKHGHGVTYFADGRVISGVWVDGKIFWERTAAIPSAGSQSVAENRVRMKSDGGTFTVPVRLNDQITLDFVVDSGASVVTVPRDVVLTLIRTKTITIADFRGEQRYVLADGSTVKSRNFILRRVTVGNQSVGNVEATIADEQGSLLLGQSFLRKFKSWSIDNAARELVLQ